MQDAFDTAYRIAQVGFATAPKDVRDELLEAGRRQIASHLVGVKFRREEMKVTAAKAAILTSALRASAPPAFAALRYDDTKLATLKNADAALVKVLRQAAERAGCAVHLGIVHIEETGPAQPAYDSRFDRRSRWNRYGDAGDEEEEDANSDDFEVIEISDASRYVDRWVDTENRAVDFGKLPLAEGEVLPAGGGVPLVDHGQRLVLAGCAWIGAVARRGTAVWRLCSSALTSGTCTIGHVMSNAPLGTE